MKEMVKDVVKDKKGVIKEIKTAIVYPFSVTNSVAFAKGGGCKCHCNCNCQCEKGK